MPSPEYLLHCTDYILGMYDQLQTVIAQDIARRIIKTWRITKSAKDQARQLQQAGLLLNEIIERVSQSTKMSNEEIERLFKEACVNEIRFDAQPLVSHGIEVDLKLSPAMRQVLSAVIEKTEGDLMNLTMTTAVSAQTQFIEAMNFAEMKLESGAFSYGKVITEAIRQSAAGGSFVYYGSGSRSRLDVAVRRALLTGVNQTAGKITELFAADNDVEYYETSAHFGARPTHAEWQGRVFKIEGSTLQYPNFVEKTGYGTGEGLCGWNCRHSFYPFWPGLSTRTYTKERLEKLNARDQEYRGDMYTVYELSQMQRAYERDIRASKRVLASLDAAMQVANDDTRAALKYGFTTESVFLKTKEAELREFCKETGREVDSLRTQVVANLDGNGRIVGFGRSTSMKAVWANRKANR